MSKASEDSRKARDPRRDSVSMAGPYARARVILAIVLVVIGLGVLGVRMIAG